MGKLVINHNKINSQNAKELVELCPFNAISYENEKLDISSILRGRVGVTQSGKKSINVKKKSDQNSLDTLKEIFRAVESTRINKQ